MLEYLLAQVTATIIVEENQEKWIICNGIWLFPPPVKVIFLAVVRLLPDSLH